MGLTEKLEGGLGCVCFCLSLPSPRSNIDSAMQAVRLKANFAASHFDLVTTEETCWVSLIIEQKVKLKIRYWLCRPQGALFLSGSSSYYF